MAVLPVAIWIGFLFCGSSAIDCYSRTGGVHTTNGSTVSCAGSSYCYSFSESTSSSFAGCSPSESACTGNPTCVVCSTDYCNSVTPSTISCYDPNSGSGNGTMVSCATGISTCYITYTGFLYSISGGCGTPPPCGDACRVCNTSYCNNRYPSTISCYYRHTALTSYSGPGYATSCVNGVSSCYSSTDSYATYGNCGTCNSNTYGSCRICNTNMCNTHLPSAISCFYRENMYVYATNSYTSPVNNGTLTQCSTGITTCYNYRKHETRTSTFTTYNDFSGCGVCNSSAPSTTGCTTCTSNRCNYFVLNTGSTTTLSTATTNRISNDITSTTSALTSTINIGMTTTMLKSVTSTSAQIYTTTVPSATSIIYTNSATSTKNGATSTAINSATSTTPTTTASSLTSTTPTTTASSLTSTLPGSSTRGSPLKCFRNLGETKPNRETKITCTLGSCFQFSFAHLYTDYYFAGCGNCSQFSTIFVNCLTCNHDYCNSAPPVLMLAVKLLIATCLICCLVLLKINTQL